MIGCSTVNLVVAAGETETTPGLEFYRQLFDSLYDGVYYVDSERRIVFWNKGAERISGYTAAEVVGRYCYENLLDHLDRTGCCLCKGSCPLIHAMQTGEPCSDRVFLRHKDGRRIAVDVHVMPVRTEQGAILGAVQVFRDASPVVALETTLEKLRELALKDPLTGLANRRHLSELLGLQVELFQRVGIPFSVVMIDLDHFKRINDTWGHLVGDKVLVRFAEILQSQCRAGDVVGRIGGEEFLILLREVHSEQAFLIVDRWRETVAAASLAAELAAHAVTISLGIAEVALGDTCESLLSRVDAALYRAKASGRNRVEVAPAAALPCSVFTALGVDRAAALGPAVSS